MPITIDPTPVTVLTPSTVQADKLHLDRITIDAAGEVSSDTNPPTVEIVSRMYSQDQAGAKTFSSTTELFKTKDLYTVAGRIPAIGVAMGAVFAGVQAWHDYRTARKADLDAAQVISDAAQATFNAAIASQTSAANGLKVARAAQFAADATAAGAGATDADRQAAAAAAEAVVTAQHLLDTAQDAVAAANTALNNALANTTTARLAWFDPANPPLAAQ